MGEVPLYDNANRANQLDPNNYRGRTYLTHKKTPLPLGPP